MQALAAEEEGARRVATVRESALGEAAIPVAALTPWAAIPARPIVLNRSILGRIS